MGIFVGHDLAYTKKNVWGIFLSRFNVYGTFLGRFFGHDLTYTNKYVLGHFFGHDLAHRKKNKQQPGSWETGAVRSYIVALGPRVTGLGEKETQRLTFWETNIYNAI